MRHLERSRLRFIFIGILTLWVALQAVPTRAQSVLDLALPSLSQSVPSDEDPIQAACVRLDGYCAFRVAAPRSDLWRRVRAIEATLAEVRDRYVPATADTLLIEIRQPSEADPATTESPPTETTRRSPELYVDIVPPGIDTLPANAARLMSVTRFDAELRGVDVETAAIGMQEQVQDTLQRSRFERQPTYLIRQGGLGGGILVVVLGISWGLERWARSLRRTKAELQDLLRGRSQSLQNVLDERQRWNITEAQLRFSQLLQVGLWASGGLAIAGLFPHTRILQVRVVEGLGIPLRLVVVSLAVYLFIRLSFALINKLAAVLASRYEITPEVNRRMQLRVKTISRVSRGIVTLLWVAMGGLVALMAIGINIAPLLAGAGIIGVALSLPAQSLIKDAINGFFIILEDQYAVGDVITVHGIRGLVENINLRITQIRDEEGRLVTIPNSEIGVIANHSSHWAQADVHIPISYHTDVDQVLGLIEATGKAMQASDRWSATMLKEPEVLGVEDFDERGLTIRVWIKTQPLKQWEVAREYRRRLKVALDAAGIVIPAHIDFKSPPGG